MDHDSTPGPQARKRRMNTRWAHTADEYGFQTYLVFFATIMVLQEQMAFMELWWMWIFVPGVVVYMFTTVSAELRHDRGLCTHCAEAFPRDPGGQAKGRSLVTLHLFHLTKNTMTWVQRWIPNLYIAQVIGMSLWMLLPMMALAFALPSPWGFSSGLVWLAVLLQTGRRHKQLADYCPWCGNNGGGDDGGDPEDVPDPDPAPGMQRRA